MSEDPGQHWHRTDCWQGGPAGTFRKGHEMECLVSLSGHLPGTLLSSHSAILDCDFLSIDWRAETRKPAVTALALQYTVLRDRGNPEVLDGPGNGHPHFVSVTVGRSLPFI